MGKGSAWKLFFREKRLLYFFLGAVIYLLLALSFFADFVKVIELRKGFSFEDPFLSLFSPVDLTWIIFALIYGSFLSWFFFVRGNPYRVLGFVFSYGLLISVRAVMMSSLPLDPPATMIALKDPLVQLFVDSEPLTRDLFFSGHTATLFLISLNSPSPPLRIFYGAGAVAVGICLLFQHVHYSVDVLVGFAVASAVHSFSQLLILKAQNSVSEQS